MPQKYALLIGNSRHDDPAWPTLAAPEADVHAIAAVLQDPRIGGFNRVDTRLNASMPEMRRALSALFAPSTHQPDDLLLLYFSGHGELDDNDDLYFVGRDTFQEQIEATGLEAGYITRLMDRARSQRQVIILDSCYSGAFGKGGTDNAVPLKDIFAGNGRGRYILASSEALQRSWERDAAPGATGEAAPEASFFTHFLVEGLRTGAADRDNDGQIHVGELYDHIQEGMAKGVRRQKPQQHALGVEGKLYIARSPVTPFERQQQRLTDWLVQADLARQQGDYAGAEVWLNKIINAGEPDEFLAATAQTILAEVITERGRGQAYRQVQALLNKKAITPARVAWQKFTARYPGYDPDNLAAHLTPAPTRPAAGGSTSTLPPTGGDRGGAAALLPAPFAWVEIPAGQVTLIETDSDTYLPKDKPQLFQVDPFAIAKYPLTNAQFAPFIKAGGYKEKQWWSDAGWQAREQGIAWNSTAREWQPTGNPWTEPRYWGDKTWNGPTQPVVGVSWYEAVAYCRWLSDRSGQKITLPTEQQWQYAAQGRDGRDYPWGQAWDCKRCNNSVKPCDSNVTTPVTHYEGKDKGDSPFGVVDMAGNVWEWCLTEYHSGSTELNGTNVRVLRGGSWGILNSIYFRASFRSGNSPDSWYYYRGFRLALSR